MSISQKNRNLTESDVAKRIKKEEREKVYLTGNESAVNVGNEP